MDFFIKRRASIGQNLYNCHNPKSAEKIRMMMQTGMSNTYEVTKHGKHYFVHHTPENYPKFNRDN